MTALRHFFCELCCPCCLYVRRRVIPSNCCMRLFYEGTYENATFKTVIGFFAGVIVTSLLYIIMVFQLKFQPISASIICTLVGMVVTIGMAFSYSIRSIVLLIIPNLFSSKGRSFLLLYVMILVMTHPVSNFNHNIMVMSDSSTCGQQMAYNQTKELVEAAISPIAGVIGSVKAVMHSLKQFAAILRRAFQMLKRTVEEIASAIGGVAKWLLSIVTACNETMGKPYQKCNKAFDDGERRCRDVLGWFLGWICGIVTAVKVVCNIAKIGELLCVITAAVKSLVIPELSMPVGVAIHNVFEMFYFNVTINYSYKFNMTQSRTYTEVKDDIMKEVKERINSFSSAADVIQYVMMFSLVFLLIRPKRKEVKKRKQDGEKAKNKMAKELRKDAAVVFSLRVYVEEVEKR